MLYVFVYQLVISLATSDFRPGRFAMESGFTLGVPDSAAAVPAREPEPPAQRAQPELLGFRALPRLPALLA